MILYDFSAFLVNNRYQISVSGYIAKYGPNVFAAWLSYATHRPCFSVYILSGPLHSSLDLYISFLYRHNGKTGIYRSNICSTIIASISQKTAPQSEYQSMKQVYCHPKLSTYNKIVELLHYLAEACVLFVIFPFKFCQSYPLEDLCLRAEHR